MFPDCDSQDPGSCHRGGGLGAGPLGAASVAGAPRGPGTMAELTYSFLTGPCPNETSGTSSHFVMTDCPEESCWSAVIQQQDGESLSVSLCSPPNACIGRYSMTLETRTDYQGSSFQMGDFVLLFNPWHPGGLSPLSVQGSQGSGKHKMLPKHLPHRSHPTADPRCPKPCSELRSKQKPSLFFHLHTIPAIGQGQEHHPHPTTHTAPLPPPQTPNALSRLPPPRGAHHCGAGVKPWAVPGASSRPGRGQGKSL